MNKRNFVQYPKNKTNKPCAWVCAAAFWAAAVSLLSPRSHALTRARGNFARSVAHRWNFVCVKQSTHSVSCSSTSVSASLRSRRPKSKLTWWRQSARKSSENGEMVKLRMLACVTEATCTAPLCMFFLQATLQDRDAALSLSWGKQRYSQELPHCGFEGATVEFASQQMQSFAAATVFRS